MDELIARIAKVPIGQRVLALAGIVVLLTVANYFFFVSPRNTQIEQADRQIQDLDSKLIQKTAIARNLPRYRVEVERLKQRLNEALTLLPNDAEIPELLQKVAARVEQSDCELSNFEPRGEVVSGFYAKIPVQMAIEGNFHSIMVFFDKVSKLSRIVNVTDIKLTAPEVENKKVVLTATFLATTFKFVENTTEQQATGFQGSQGN
ncbi:MAG: type 4a pilus biogenesis protein PilO [Myxococcota bacterium]